MSIDGEDNAGKEDDTLPQRSPAAHLMIPGCNPLVLLFTLAPLSLLMTIAAEEGLRRWTSGWLCRSAMSKYFVHSRYKHEPFQRLGGRCENGFDTGSAAAVV